MNIIPKFYVSRQYYYGNNNKLVEIAFPSIDYSGSDMLTPKYAEEGEYSDPREAFRAAIKLYKQWRKEDKEVQGITLGYYFDMVEGEPMPIKDIRRKIDTIYEGMSKCDFCGELLEETYYINEDSEFTDDKFCSERCASRAYEEYYTLCSICEREGQRKDLNYIKSETFICDKCQEIENNYGEIELEKVNDFYVGWSIEDQEITRHLLRKTYLNKKDFNVLKDMLEKLEINIIIYEGDEVKIINTFN
jgi:hypothetical protein